MQTLLTALYSQLDIAIFIYENDAIFKQNGHLPDWATIFLADATEDSDIALLARFPYLDCFMAEASEHWQAEKSIPLYSGPWIERDFYGKEWPLEAIALYLDQKKVLLLQHLGDKYQQELNHLQHYRSARLRQEKLEAELTKRTLDLRRREEEMALKLVSLTSFRDEETGTHVRRIGLYAAAMAEALHWDSEQIDHIRVAAPMHDIGKIGIPDRILRKEGVLTDEEFALMKRHTDIGATMLCDTQIPVLDMAAAIARHHHERWDGNGYPQGLAGEAIPIAARITTIVDIYDALVHERVYKKAMPEEEAISLMKAMSGRHLDPHLLTVFLSLLPQMRQIRQEVREPNRGVISAEAVSA